MFVDPYFSQICSPAGSDGEAEAVGDGAAEPVGDGAVELVVDGDDRPLADGDADPVVDEGVEPVIPGDVEPVAEGIGRLSVAAGSLRGLSWVTVIGPVGITPSGAGITIGPMVVGNSDRDEGRELELVAVGTADADVDDGRPSEGTGVSTSLGRRLGNGMPLNIGSVGSLDVGCVGSLDVRGRVGGSVAVPSCGRSVSTGSDDCRDVPLGVRGARESAEFGEADSPSSSWFGTPGLADRGSAPVATVVGASDSPGAAVRGCNGALGVAVPPPAPGGGDVVGTSAGHDQIRVGP